MSLISLLQMIHFPREDGFGLAAIHFWLLDHPSTSTTFRSQRLLQPEPSLGHLRIDSYCL